MKIKRIKIKNFQSFSAPKDIILGNGINLLIGQNNSGKSAVIRALHPNTLADAHRNPEKWKIHTLSTPSSHITVEASIGQLNDIFFLRRRTALKTKQSGKLLEKLQTDESCPVDIEFEKYPGGQFVTERTLLGEMFSDVNTGTSCLIVTATDGKIEYNVNSYGDADEIISVISSLYKNNIFYFDAERMNVGEGDNTRAEKLLPNAGNLPAWLHRIKGEEGDKFNKLVQHLREIFPSFGNLSIRINEANRLEIRVWPTERQEHVELSFPLNQSGTGLSQTIALLAAIISMENSVIIIDEINSFLHPSAVKSLLRIIQTEYMSHQYIISTHAPEVISFSNPTTVHLIKKSGYKSDVEKLDLGDVEYFKTVADHLGVSMSDVFAAEKVIWVEGPTEELCFPWLYRQVKGNSLPRGTVFIPVMATGDFTTKKRDCARIFEIYERLSKASTPLVVSVAFSFDSEELSPTEKADLIKRSANKMHFLPRRHLECYVLESNAIAAFINQRDQHNSSLSATDVATKIVEYANRPAFRSTAWQNDISDEEWLSHVDAAKLISKVCSDLSDQRVTFNKKADTLFLLQHIQENNPDILATLMHYVAKLVISE